MAEIKVTYETLFDLLRREKGRSELQDLESSFYEDVRGYIREKKNSYSASSSRGEREKINIQLKNVKKILKELYELREKKIVALASSKVRTGSDLIDTSKFLDVERKFFEDACDLFYKYKSEVLDVIFDDDFVGDARESKKVKSFDEKERGEDFKKEESNSSPAGDDEVVNLRILNNLPRFLGVDKKIYGPFNKGDETSMPISTAKLLLDKNRAERI